MSVSSDTSSMMDCKDGVKIEPMEVDSDTCDEFGRPLTPVPPPDKKPKLESPEVPTINEVCLIRE